MELCQQGHTRKGSNQTLHADKTRRCESCQEQFGKRGPHTIAGYLAPRRLNRAADSYGNCSSMCEWCGYCLPTENIYPHSGA